MCQRYNLKANHNWVALAFTSKGGVYQCVKDTIWKQITTIVVNMFDAAQVFISVSKIQFESKSQPAWSWWKCPYRCLSVCQRYNLKANHNKCRVDSKKQFGVYQCVKDTIWKQITTWMHPYWLHHRCLSVCQRYNLKANHNGVAKGWLKGGGVYQCVKDTIWKQITTQIRTVMLTEGVFISVSKIQFESKSQQ